MNASKSSTSSIRVALFITCALILVSLTGLIAWAQTCKPYDYSNGVLPVWRKGDTVYVNLSNLNDEQRRQVTAAIGMWNQANQSDGSNVTFQILGAGQTAPTGASTLTVGTGTTISPDGNQANRPSAQTNTAGCVSGTGTLVCATITFDLTVVAPGPTGMVQALDETTSGDIFIKAMLHEMGHTMGLPDVVIDRTQNCGGQTAGGSVMNGLCGANDYAGNMATSVTGCDRTEVNNVVNRTACPVEDANACYYGGGLYDTLNCFCYGGSGGYGGYYYGGGGGSNLDSYYYGYDTCVNMWDESTYTTCATYGGQTECETTTEYTLIDSFCY